MFESLDGLSGRFTGQVLFLVALASIPVVGVALEQQRDTALAIGGLYGLVLGTSIVAFAIGTVNDEGRQRRSQE